MSKIVSMASVVLALAGCRPSAATQAPVEPSALLDAARAPQSQGRLVYRGTVFARGGAVAPLFRYQRRVRDDGALRVSTHLTLDGVGDPLIVQRATHDADYGLRRFETHQAQTGATGILTVADGVATFNVTRDGVTRTRAERVEGPVVVGPTLFGAVLRHWDTLVTGESVRVRFADVERLRTFPFDVRLHEAGSDATTFSIAAASALVRMAVPEMRLVFDTPSRTIVRYEGLVPPMVRRGRALTRLDATVDYELVAGRYE